ncbi:rhomboid family intramembrane serine protease [Halosimplex litoreum]|uniref:Rhomboid family intramembrane serine protease n=1 Tax=Halosimplex litoreum TaxID=1198301 RepID=A0A7T3FW41_9EURY|nr:rhomboid family intramembrane serine protease [Halosimplex litoreum]QPV61834.1 rhomboid family intramembrane serine protease [Halosimplex litoreum]
MTGYGTESDGPLGESETPATVALLGVFLAVYVALVATEAQFDIVAFRSLAVRSDRLWLVPTWLTATLIHGPPVHLLMNGVFLFLFGGGLERTYGSRVLVTVFLVTGVVTAVLGTVLAGLNDCGLAAFRTGTGCRAAGGGSSMALAGLIGYVTRRRPSVPFYILPSSRASVPLWWFTATLLVVSLLGMYTPIDPLRAAVGFPVGHAYHFVGVLVGAALESVWTPDPVR